MSCAYMAMRAIWRNRILAMSFCMRCGGKARRYEARRPEMALAIQLASWRNMRDPMAPIGDVCNKRVA